MKRINKYILEKLHINKDVKVIYSFVDTANYELKSINELKKLDPVVFDHNFIDFIKGNILSVNFNTLYVWDDSIDIRKELIEKVKNYRKEKLNSNYVDCDKPQSISNNNYVCVLLADKKVNYAEVFIYRGGKIIYLIIAE